LPDYPTPDNDLFLLKRAVKSIDTDVMAIVMTLEKLRWQRKSPQYRLIEVGPA